MRFAHGARPLNDMMTKEDQTSSEARANETGDVSVAAESPPSESVEELRAKIASLEEGLLRAKADYQNLLRRSQSERTEAVAYANARLMQSLVNVVDDFERSLAAGASGENAQRTLDGVRLVHENLMKALRENGLERIDALQRTFDPTIHSALMQRATKDFPPGTVVEELTKGYRLRDRLIRPASVVVSAADGESPSSRTANDEEPGEVSRG